MPNYQSPAFYIDFSRLAPPKVIEEIDYEVLLRKYRSSVVSKMPSLARAVSLEQSPTNVILEVEAYAEMMVRARVNNAARAVMLAFARGSDLDNLAAFYNVERAAIVDNPRLFTTNPEDWEDDASFRKQVQLAPEAFSSAGGRGAYIFHAKQADRAGIRDVSVDRIAPGRLRISLMANGSNPVPTAAQIAKVRAYLFRPEIKPLTDDVSVVAARPVDVAVKAKVWLYPGPDATLVMNDIGTALTNLRARLYWLGQDLTRSSLIAAMNQEGVQDVELSSPNDNVVIESNQFCNITSIEIAPQIARRS